MGGGEKGGKMIKQYSVFCGSFYLSNFIIGNNLVRSKKGEEVVRNNSGIKFYGIGRAPVGGFIDDVG